MQANKVKPKKILLKYLAAVLLIVTVLTNYSVLILAQNNPDANNQINTTQPSNVSPNANINNQGSSNQTVFEPAKTSIFANNTNYLIQLGYSWFVHKPHPMKQYTGNQAYNAAKGEGSVLGIKAGFIINTNFRYLKLLKAIGISMEYYNFGSDNESMFGGKVPSGVDNLRYYFNNILINIDLFWFQNFSHNSLPIKFYTGFGLGYSLGNVSNKDANTNLRASLKSIPLHGELGFMLFLKYVGFNISVRSTKFFTLEDRSVRANNFANKDFVSSKINAALLIGF